MIYASSDNTKFEGELSTIENPMNKVSDSTKLVLSYILAWGGRCSVPLANERGEMVEFIAIGGTGYEEAGPETEM